MISYSTTPKEYTSIAAVGRSLPSSSSGAALRLAEDGGLQGSVAARGTAGFSHCHAIGGDNSAAGHVNSTVDATETSSRRCWLMLQATQTSRLMLLGPARTRQLRQGRGAGEKEG